MKEFTEPMVEIVELEDDMIVTSGCNRECVQVYCETDCIWVCMKDCKMVSTN